MKHEGTEEVFLPHIKISDDDFIFTYDLLSSYLSNGTYIIEDGKLTLTTDDKNYSYVFQIDKENLIFLKEESSSVSLFDSRLGVEVTDSAIFHLKDD
jgi:hypothetical protein